MMSKIEAFIKKLELEKKKVEFFQHILKSTEEYDQEEYREVKDEVVRELKAFVESRINKIETSATKTTTDTKIKPVQEPQKAEPEVLTKETSQEELDPAAKMRFAMEHRSLAGKTASFEAAGDTISGEIVGLDAPNVVVLSQSGVRHSVNINSIQIN